MELRSAFACNICLLALLLLFCICRPEAADATSCSPTSFEESYENASAVFIGRVTWIEPIKVDLVAYNANITFQVKELWKGEAKNTLTVNESYINASRSRFEIFTDYLVFAQKRSDNNSLLVSWCNIIRPLDDGYRIVRQLDKLKTASTWNEPYWSTPLLMFDKRDFFTKDCLEAALMHHQKENRCNEHKLDKNE